MKILSRGGEWIVLFCGCIFVAWAWYINQSIGMEAVTLLHIIWVSGFYLTAGLFALLARIFRSSWPLLISYFIIYFSSFIYISIRIGYFEGLNMNTFLLPAASFIIGFALNVFISFQLANRFGPSIVTGFLLSYFVLAIIAGLISGEQSAFLIMSYALSYKGFVDVFSWFYILIPSAIAYYFLATRNEFTASTVTRRPVSKLVNQSKYAVHKA